MQSKRKSRSRKVSFKTIAVFIGLMFVAYLPMTSFQFFIKNDAFRGYFPAKFFISEAVNSNNFPWWNPYINFGIPQYGDMNSGFWSPITWIIAYTFKYNAYTFTAELMLYLFLAGIGMYQLCRTYKFTKSVSYITGAAYLCSGYMIGHLQHFNWISGAAFLPWCIWGYHMLIDRFSLKNALQTAIIFYLFLSSAHPGLIIGGIYFFIGYALMTFFQKKNEAEKAFRMNSFLRKHLWVLIPLLLLCYGMIVGYSDIIPNMTRGNKLATVSTFTNAFSIQSLTSLLIPLATVKGSGFFLTDISMRNMYMGLLLLFFLIIALRSEKNLHQKFLLGAGIFFFLISLGGPFHYLNYYVLPLMGYVRMPGEFIIFSLFCLLLFSAYGLNSFITEKKEFSEAYEKSYKLIKYFLRLFIGIGVLGIILTQKSILFSVFLNSSKMDKSSILKLIISNISFFDILIFQSIIQIYFIKKIKISLITRNFKKLIQITFAELILATLLNIPFTGVGKLSVGDINYIISKSPEGIPNPFLLNIDKSNNESYFDESPIGSWNFYNKQIGSKYYHFYPIELNTTKNIFKDSISFFSNKPYLFLLKETNINKIKILNYKVNSVELFLETNEDDTLIFQQNIYPLWTCSLNSQPNQIIKYKNAFNATYLPKGKNYVSFQINTNSISHAYDISKLVLLICTLYILIVYFRRSSPS